MYQEDIGGMLSQKFQAQVKPRDRGDEFIDHIWDREYKQIAELQGGVLAEKVGQIQQRQTGDKFACLYCFIPGVPVSPFLKPVFVGESASQKNRRQITPEFHPHIGDREGQHTGGWQQKIPELFVGLVYEGHHCDQQNGVGKVPPSDIQGNDAHIRGKPQAVDAHAEQNMGGIHVGFGVKETDGLPHHELFVQNRRDIDDDNDGFQFEQPPGHGGYAFRGSLRIFALQGPCDTESGEKRKAGDADLKKCDDLGHQNRI